MNSPTELARSPLAESISAAFWRVMPTDLDPIETREWLDGFGSLVREGGVDRGTYILRRLLDQARASQVPLPAVLNTPYINSITLDLNPSSSLGSSPGGEPAEVRR